MYFDVAAVTSHSREILVSSAVIPGSRQGSREKQGKAGCVVGVGGVSFSPSLNCRKHHSKMQHDFLLPPEKLFRGYF